MQHTCLHRLDRNYVLITEIRMPRERFLKIHPTFFRIQLKLKLRVHPYTTEFLRKPYPNLDQNRAKTMYPLGAAHTFMACIRKKLYLRVYRL